MSGERFRLPDDEPTKVDYERFCRECLCRLPVGSKDVLACDDCSRIDAESDDLHRAEEHERAERERTEPPRDGT